MKIKKDNSVWGVAVLRDKKKWPKNHPPCFFSIFSIGYDFSVAMSYYTFAIKAENGKKFRIGKGGIRKHLVKNGEWLPNGFFTHPALNKKLEELVNARLLNEERPVGSCSVDISKRHKNIHFDEFHPYGKVAQSHWKPLQNFGIASFVRIAILRDIAKHISLDYPVHSVIPTEPLRAFLAKRGIDVKRDYPLGVYLAKLEDYSAKHSHTD